MKQKSSHRGSVNLGMVYPCERMPSEMNTEKSRETCLWGKMERGYNFVLEYIDRKRWEGQALK